MSRDIIPIRAVDLDLLRRELELDPTGRGYGLLVSFWHSMPEPCSTAIQRMRLQLLAEIMLQQLTRPDLDIPQGCFSRATQLGLVAVTSEDIAKALEL